MKVFLKKRVPRCVSLLEKCEFEKHMVPYAVIDCPGEQVDVELQDDDEQDEKISEELDSRSKGPSSRVERFAVIYDLAGLSFVIGWKLVSTFLGQERGRSAHSTQSEHVSWPDIECCQYRSMGTTRHSTTVLESYAAKDESDSPRMLPAALRRRRPRRANVPSVLRNQQVAVRAEANQSSEPSAL